MTSSGWEFNRTVSLGNLLTMVVIACSGAGIVMSLDKRITVLEERQAVQISIDRNQEERLKDITAEVRGQLKDIDTKLDKLMERQFNLRVQQQGSK